MSKLEPCCYKFAYEVSEPKTPPGLNFHEIQNCPICSRAIDLNFQILADINGPNRRWYCLKAQYLN